VLQDHLLLAVGDCLFSIVTSTLPYTWVASSKENKERIKNNLPLPPPNLVLSWTAVLCSSNLLQILFHDTVSSQYKMQNSTRGNNKQEWIWSGHSWISRLCPRICTAIPATTTKVITWGGWSILGTGTSWIHVRSYCFNQLAWHTVTTVSLR